MPINQVAAGEANLNYNIMPDLTKQIETFNGETSGSAAREWLECLTGMQRLHHWPDTFALEIARMQLIGGAKDWFRTHKQDLVTWAQFRIAFQRTFVTTESHAVRWKKMVERVQRKEEVVSTYFHAKVKLCKNLGLSDEETKEQILVGFWSKDLYIAMAARSHCDLDELYRDIAAYSRVEDQRVDRIRGQRTTTVERPRSADYSNSQGVNSSSNTSRFATDSKLPVKTERSEIKCFNCNKLGHFSRDCEETRRELICLNCQQKGHTQKHCPAKQTTQSVSTVNHASLDHVGALKVYIKDVSVGGEMLKGLVDTGSAVCTIKVTQALIRGLPFNAEPEALKSFGPKSFQVISPGTVSVDITIDGVTVSNVVARVVPDEVQPFDMLIGRTFTAAHGVELRQVNGELFFNRSEPAPFAEMDILPSTSSSIRASEDYEAAAHSVQFIRMMTDDHRYELPVVNFSETTRQIKENEVFEIGEIAPVPILSTRVQHREIGRDDINVGEENSEVVITDLLKVLNSYRDTIALSVDELGCTDLVQMDIHVKPNSNPVYGKPYRASESERAEIRKIVGEYKRIGAVRETNSAYASPAFLVKKKNGESRLVVDFRKLNLQTERTHFPLPNIDEHLALISDAKLFITLDLAHGYLQVPLTEDAISKTAFITPDETGEFTRVMFGLMNAPFYFMKTMYRALGPLRDQVVLFYLDDILIPGRDWEDLKSRLSQTLAALRKAGLTIKLQKCQFLQSKVTYLGHEISGSGIEPGRDKLRAVAEFPTPKNVHEVRRFLGLAGFFRKFVPKFAERAGPLHALLKKEQTFTWQEKEQLSFQDIRDALVNGSTLKTYNPKHETELHTDASAVGLAGMLLQRGNDGRFHLVYAISRRTDVHERNYHSSKLELLAIIWAVERLRPLLINIPFTIISDCQALTYLKSTNNAQSTRWRTLLEDFNAEIVHRPGRQLAHVDALSRAPVDPAPIINDPESKAGAIFSIINTEDEILMHQCAEPTIKRKCEILRKPIRERSKTENCEVREYELHNSVLYRKEGQGLLFVVPNTMRKSIAVRFHDLRSHPGLERTIAAIRHDYYFPAMKRYIKQHIGACLHCLLNKPKVGRQAGQLHPIPPGDRPFAVVHMDHVGPLVTSIRGNKYVLALIDNLTRFAVLKATKDTKTTGVTRLLNEFILQFGAPARIITDRGTCFTSKQFEEVCLHHGIRHVLNSPRHAQANGMVERLNGTLLPAMQASLIESEGRDWDNRLKYVQRDLNTSRNQTTGKSPFELLYGYAPKHDEGALRTLLDEGPSSYTHPTTLQDAARERIAVQQGKYKARYDRNRLSNAKFHVGDIVAMSTTSPSAGESSKFQSRFRGALSVTEILPADTYRVSELRNDRGGKRYYTTAHASQLKIWRPTTEDEHADIIDSDEEAEDEIDHDEDAPEQENCDEIIPVNEAYENEAEKTSAPPQEIQPRSTGEHATLRRSGRERKAPTRFADCDYDY